MRRRMNRNAPSTRVFEQLEFLGSWEPVASLAQDFGMRYTSLRQAVRRWEKDGLVETRVVNLALHVTPDGSLRGHENRGSWDQRVEVRIV